MKVKCNVFGYIMIMEVTSLKNYKFEKLQVTSYKLQVTILCKWFTQSSMGFGIISFCLNELSE